MRQMQDACTHLRLVQLPAPPEFGFPLGGVCYDAHTVTQGSAVMATVMPDGKVYPILPTMYDLLHFIWAMLALLLCV